MHDGRLNHVVGRKEITATSLKVLVKCDTGQHRPDATGHGRIRTHIREGSATSFASFLVAKGSDAEVDGYTGWDARFAAVDTLSQSLRMGRPEVAVEHPTLLLSVRPVMTKETFVELDLQTGHGEQGVGAWGLGDAPAKHPV